MYKYIHIYTHIYIYIKPHNWCAVLYEYVVVIWASFLSCTSLILKGPNIRCVLHRAGEV